MSPVPQHRVDQMRATIHEMLKGKASDVFLGKIDSVVNDWAAEKLTASQACEKVQKMVALFIDQDMAREIGNRCAPIVMKDSLKT